MTASAVPAAGEPAAVVDIHAHVLHPDVYAQTVNHNVVSGFGARPMEQRPRAGSPRWPIFAKMTDPTVQIADMDARGVAHAVISTSTVSQSTAFADPGLAAALDQQANEGIADWVRAYPDRFTGTFTVPVQDIPRVIAALGHAVSIGLRIVNLPACYGGHYLGEPYFRPLWEAIAAMDLTVFVHPDGIRDPAFQDYSLWNAIGQGIEETRTMASMIYGGLFDAHPALRVVMSHAGGYLPLYIARLDRNAHAHPTSTRNISRLPSAYLQNFFYDTVTYDPLIIDLVVRRVGAAQVLFGSDYPFGDPDPRSLLDGCDLAPDARRAVMGGNAMALLARSRAAGKA